MISYSPTRRGADRNMNHGAFSRASTRPRISVVAILAAMLLGGCAVSVPNDIGVRDGVLAPCPDSPNCVCSERGERNAPIDPLAFDDDPAGAFDRAATAVAAIGGEIIERRGDYLHATFTTRFLRFVDDLELRLDAAGGVIHVRSSSRVGYYDFNVNQKRAARLRDAYADASR